MSPSPHVSPFMLYWRRDNVHSVWNWSQAFAREKERVERGEDHNQRIDPQTHSPFICRLWLIRFRNTRRSHQAVGDDLLPLQMVRTVRRQRRCTSLESFQRSRKSTTHKNDDGGAPTSVNTIYTRHSKSSSTHVTHPHAQTCEKTRRSAHESKRHGAREEHWNNSSDMYLETKRVYVASPLNTRRSRENLQRILNIYKGKQTHLSCDLCTTAPTALVWKTRQKIVEERHRQRSMAELSMHRLSGSSPQS